MDFLSCGLLWTKRGNCLGNAEGHGYNLTGVHLLKIVFSTDEDLPFHVGSTLRTCLYLDE